MGNIILNGKEFGKTSDVTACKEKALVTGSARYDQGRKGQYLFKEGEKFEIKPFAIGQYEVTQELYKAVLENDGDCIFSPSKFRAFPKEGEVQELRPVDQVTWFDAVYFCNELTKKTMGEEHCVYTITNIKRSEKPAFHEEGAFEFVGFLDGVPVEQYTGKGSIEYQFEPSDKGYIYSAEVTADYTKKGYRLPTEIEWEYAARCGENAEIPFGDDAISEAGWYLKNSDGRTHEVGLKKPNGLGLYDMSGNVCEWCSDLYVHNGFDDVRQRVCNERQARGGDFNHNASLASVARRDYREPANRLCNSGFRLARSI